MTHLPVNIRIGAWHLQVSDTPRFGLYRNKGHARGGEFRKAGWKWFAVYSLLGYAR
jgi:hypothetical protein